MKRLFYLLFPKYKRIWYNAPLHTEADWGVWDEEGKYVKPVEGLRITFKNGSVWEVVELIYKRGGDWIWDTDAYDVILKRIR